MAEERYTQKTLAALQSAQQTAALHYHQEITSAHLLLALAKEPEGLLGTIFEESGVDLPMLKARLEHVASSDFGRVSYTEAVELLKSSGHRFDFPVEWGIDLQTEHER